MREELIRRLTPLPNPRVEHDEGPERPAAGEPEGALVLFHGRGANEYDLLPLLDALDPERRLDGSARAGRCRCRPAARTGNRAAVGYPDPESFAQGLRLAAAGFVDCAAVRKRS